MLGCAHWDCAVTQAPFEVWLAIPPHIPTPRLDQPALRVVRMSGPALTEGIEHIEIDGVQVPVFNAAKTVADCFKFRNQIGLDVAAGGPARCLGPAQADDGCALALRSGQSRLECDAALPGKHHLGRSGAACQVGRRASGPRSQAVMRA